MIEGTVYNKRMQIIAALCLHLRMAGASEHFAIVHGLTPDGKLGRDVDFLVDAQSLGLVVGNACDYFEKIGFVTSQYNVVRGLLLFAYDREDPLNAVEVDFATCFSWSFIPLVGGARAPVDLVEIGGIPFATWGGFAKRVLIQYLSGQINKYRSPNKIQELKIFEHEKNVVEARLSKLFGSLAAESLCTAIMAQDWRWLEANLLRLRIRLLSRSLLNLGFANLRVVRNAAKFWKWSRHPPQFAPDVVLQGGAASKHHDEWLRQFEGILADRYIFTKTIRLKADSDSDLQVACKTLARKTPLLSLYVVIGALAGRVSTTRRTLTIDVKTMLASDAASLVIVEHAKMLQTAGSIRTV